MVDEDTPLGRLMHDFRCTRPEDMYYDVLAERVRYFKETEEGASAMCEAMEKLARDFAGELVQEAEARGMERGMERGREERNIAVVLRPLCGHCAPPLQKPSQSACACVLTSWGFMVKLGE